MGDAVYMGSKHATTDATGREELDEWERPTVFYNKYVKWTVYATVAGFVLWSAWGLRVPPERLVIGVEAGGGMVADMFPPDFGPMARSRIWTGIIDT